MYDFVRWTLLALIFIGLFGFYAWSWYRNHGKTLMARKPVEDGFKVIQKRSIDYRTGVCLIEAFGESYLLAYTSDGGVGWQRLGTVKAEAAEKAQVEEPALDTREQSFPALCHAAKVRMGS
jgi:hypothetical protein